MVHDSPAQPRALEVSVVLCAYTEERRGDLLAAVASIREQSMAAREIVVVTDNNPELLAWVEEEMPDVIALENTGYRGAGEARNCGVLVATGSIVAFLDDDAVAAPNWVERAATSFDDQRVVGVGGIIEPAWDTTTPKWMAEEFYWTVGCTYPGLPTSPAAVRNLIATNMFVRRAEFLALGGFRARFGKTGRRSGTEETDLCIRASQKWPDKIWLYDPDVIVTHRVPRERSNVKYFVSRCYDEGVAKASIVGFVGAHDGLAAERAYTSKTLPQGIIRGLKAGLIGRDASGLARSFSILIGLAATTTGYLVGKLARPTAPVEVADPSLQGFSSRRHGDTQSRNGALSGRVGINRRQVPLRGVVVVGSGTHFISGVSHYTRYVSLALAKRTPTAVILMRRLIPRSLYPGRDRVGDKLTDEAYPPEMPVFDGVDWYWMPSIFRALRFLWEHRPEAVVFQWWTGAVLHSYLLLAAVARLSGARVIIEIHEIQDTGEAGMAPARRYVQRFGRRLMAKADGYLVHSEFDRAAVESTFGINGRPVRIVRHGPFSHYKVSQAMPLREPPNEACNVLFFGTIRPYKGLEDLVQAFEILAAESDDWWLTIVGETWEDWTGPLELIEGSKYRDRITLINYYVCDAEVSQWFAGADVVALPYRRSSASGPLHLTMDAGLPVVVTDVGGLGEASDGYAGAVLVPAADPTALAAGLREALNLRGQRFEDAGSWDSNAEAVLELLQHLAPAPQVVP